MKKAEHLMRTVLAHDLTAFIDRSFLELHPGETFDPALYVRALAYKLDQVARGDVRRLIIAMPPRHLKSHCASVAFPAWLLGRDPGCHIITASYAQGLSEGFSLRTRQLMTSAWYANAFPASAARLKRETKAELWTRGGGSRIATSVGGTLTGKGGDVIIVDDAMKAEDAMSETARQYVQTWYRTTLSSRLDDPKTGRIIVIAQRLHQDDLVGYLIAQGGWDVLELPAIAPTPKSYALADGVFWDREAGDLLDPDRIGETELNQIRAELGSMAFEAQYQQRPAPPGGNLIKLEWFRRYEESERPALNAFEAVVQSWDTAAVPGEGNAFSVCTTWGLLGEKIYLIDVFRQQLDYPHLKRAALDRQEKFGARMVVFENASSGQALYSDLRSSGALWAASLTPKGDKATRLSRQTAKIEAGEVWIPNAAPWLSDFEMELAAFPNGKHDDQVDSVSQMLHALDWRPAAIRELSRYAGKPANVPMLTGYGF